MHDEADVLAVNEAFYRAFNTRDFPGMDEVWDQDGLVLCAHPGWPALVGREQVMASWRGLLANPDQVRVVARHDQVLVHGDMAMVLGRELAGGAPVLATNLFVRRAKGWKLFHHHAGPVAALA